MPKVTVDGVEIEVSQGGTVLQACELALNENVSPVPLCLQNGNDSALLKASK